MPRNAGSQSLLASGATWGPGRGVRDVPKEMALGERKIRE